MARLQGVPDALPVPASEQAANSLFGNVVCVDVVQGVFESLVFLERKIFSEPVSQRISAGQILRVRFFWRGCVFLSRHPERVLKSRGSLDQLAHYPP